MKRTTWLCEKLPDPDLKKWAFTCPDCGEGYDRYFDGHDCPCGKIHLCTNCFGARHTEHYNYDWPNQ